MGEWIQFIIICGIFGAAIIFGVYSAVRSFFSGKPLGKILKEGEAFIVANWPNKPMKGKICVISIPLREEGKDTYTEARFCCPIISHKSKNYLSLFAHKDTLKRLNRQAILFSKVRHFYAGWNVIQIDVSSLHFILSHVDSNIEGIIIDHMCVNQQLVDVDEFLEAADVSAL